MESLCLWENKIEVCQTEMIIREVKKNKKQYWDLLFLADEQESMIEKYLDSGRMFVLEESGCVTAECVVTKEEDGVAEIKNIATRPQFQRQGYARKLVEYVEQEYGKECQILRVGTGDSPLTIPFYKKCGFSEVYRIKNFFTDNYDHPIFEEGVQLIDMVYLSKEI